MSNHTETFASSSPAPTLKNPAYAGHPVLPVTLVLEGGSMRSMFTAGVLDFFMEHGIVCDQVIGVSAGALSGENYVAGLYGYTAFLNLKFCDDPRYFSMKSFRETGNICGREFMFHEVPNELYPFDKAWFDNSPMHLTAVSTNIVTGQADYHHVQNLEEDLAYLIASSSLPFLSQPVEVDDKLLLDGGTADSIPYAWSFEHFPTHKVIVVLTREAAYEKKLSKTLPITESMYSGYPKYTDLMYHRYFEYNKQHRAALRMHEEGRVFTLAPQKPITLRALEHDRTKLLDLYAQGYAQAAENWDELQAFLGIGAQEDAQ